MLRAYDLDSLIGEDHPARVICAYAIKLDMSDFEACMAPGRLAGHASDLAAPAFGALALCDDDRSPGRKLKAARERAERIGQTLVNLVELEKAGQAPDDQRQPDQAPAGPQGLHP